MIKEHKTKYDTNRQMTEFIRTMDEFAHNGTLKEPDQEAVLNLARYYIRQCDPSSRAQLTRDILTVLNVKYQYRNAEKLLSLEPAFEKRIVEKIRNWLKMKSVESVRLVGFAVQWTFSFSSRLVRTYVEPAVTQTALTCSLVVNPVLPALQAETVIVKINSSAMPSQSVNVNKEPVRDGNLYADLQYVKWYRDAVLNEIGREINARGGQPAKKAVTRKINTTDRTAHQVVIEKSLPENKWNVDVDRRRMEPAKAKVTGGNAAVTRKIRELRSQSEIHTVLSENDLRFRNCVKPFKSRSSSGLLRLPVRFDITPCGNVSNIAISALPGNGDLAQRMTIQLMQLRFSKVEAQLGDQTVYHTFFY